MNEPDAARLDALLAAVADRTRRRLLERLLAEPGVTTGRLASDLPQLSRWAVAKHLGVLRDAGLVRTMPEGRRRRHWAQAAGLDALKTWLAAVR